MKLWIVIAEIEAMVWAESQEAAMKIGDSALRGEADNMSIGDFCDWARPAEGRLANGWDMDAIAYGAPNDETVGELMTLEALAANTDPTEKP